MNQGVKKYLNAYLNKRWLIIHDPENGSDWIIDVKNKYWIIEFEKFGKCWYRYQVFYEISELYDMELSEVVKVMKDWVEEVLKRGVITTDDVVPCRALWVEEVLRRTHLR